MRKLFFQLLAISFTVLLLTSCQKKLDKPEQTTEVKSENFFYLTSKADKKYAATYQATPLIDGSIGGFNFKEIKPGSNMSYYFYSFKMNFDAMSSAVMEIKLSSPPQLGMTYHYNGGSVNTVQSVVWDLTLDNIVYSSVKGDVTFTAFAVPGRIKGTARAFNAANGDIANSEFDFVVR